jgi:hypothetical protein
MAVSKYSAVKLSIERLKEFLHEEYISEECKTDRVLGCISCQMTKLVDDLDMVLEEIKSAENDSVRLFGREDA